MSNSQAVIRRQQKMKSQALIYKGNCCVICGYNRSRYSLTFHHIDPEKKDFGISTGIRSWSKLQKELDKCVLLCANCHGEIHEGITILSNFGPTPEEGLKLIKEAGFKIIDSSQLSSQRCRTCGTPITKKATECKPCHASKQRTKINWPTSDELYRRVVQSSRHQVAKELGVSDNAIKKRLLRYPPFDQLN